MFPSLPSTFAVTVGNRYIFDRKSPLQLSSSLSFVWRRRRKVEIQLQLWRKHLLHSREEKKVVCVCTLWISPVGVSVMCFKWSSIINLCVFVCAMVWAVGRTTPQPDHRWFALDHNHHHHHQIHRKVASHLCSLVGFFSFTKSTMSPTSHHHSLSIVCRLIITVIFFNLFGKFTSFLGQSSWGGGLAFTERQCLSVRIEFDECGKLWPTFLSLILPLYRCVVLFFDWDGEF